MEVALQPFRLSRGYASEGRNNLRALLAHPAIASHDVARGHALYVGAALASDQGDDQEAQRMLETCLALRRGIDNQLDIGATLSTLAAVRLRLGDAARARTDEEEALGIFRTVKERTGEAIALLHLGEVCAYVGEDANARGFLAQALAFGRAIEHAEIQSDCERVLGQLALERGDTDEARACFARALSVCQVSGDTRGASLVAWWLGKIALADDDGTGALPHLRAAIRAFDSSGMNAEAIGVIEDCARLACSCGLAHDAACLLGAASAARQQLSIPRAPRLEPRYRHELDSLRAALGNAAFETAWNEGHEWSLAQAVRRALAVDPA